MSSKITKKLDKKLIAINRSAILLSEIYQLLGNLEFGYKSHKKYILPMMDIIGNELNELDEYYNDELYEKLDKQLEKQITKGLKKYCR